MRIKGLALPAMVLFFVALNIAFPVVALKGAKEGIQLFLETVLPALLPFFAATTMLIRSGLAHLLAGWLSPLMKPLFRLPGASALAFVLSLFGGNPNGARATSELFAQGLLTPSEAERTIALASTAGPAFILSAIAGSMLKAPQYGAVLLYCHILSAIAVCEISSFFTSKTQVTREIKRGIDALHTQSASKIFIQSVHDTAAALWGIGSFIIFFSTLTALCRHIGLYGFIAKPVAVLLKPLGFSPLLAEPFLLGVMEITDGCHAVCDLALPAVQKVPILCAIISFGGCSVLSQAYLFAGKCGMRLSRLALYYTVQGIIALFLCTAALRIIPFAQSAAVPAFGGFHEALVTSTANMMTAVASLLGLGCMLSLCSTLFGRTNRRKKPSRIE
jgi:sporulation integral membrane protein YlbJ